MRKNMGKDNTIDKKMENQIEKLLKKLTLDEKIAMVHGKWFIPDCSGRETGYSGT